MVGQGMTLANSPLTMSLKSSNPFKATILPWVAVGVGIGAALMYLIDPARKRGRMTNNKPLNQPEVPDDILEERVRSEFHRKIRHAKGIDIQVREGVVTVSGPILVDEVDTLISCIQSVPGVQRVEDHLQAHQTQPYIQ